MADHIHLIYYSSKNIFLIFFDSQITWPKIKNKKLQVQQEWHFSFHRFFVIQKACRRSYKHNGLSLRFYTENTL